MTRPHDGGVVIISRAAIPPVKMLLTQEHAVLQPQNPGAEEEAHK